MNKELKEDFRKVINFVATCKRAWQVEVDSAHILQRVFNSKAYVDCCRELRKVESAMRFLEIVGYSLIHDDLSDYERAELIDCSLMWLDYTPFVWKKHYAK